jgi:hypothetical protein
MLGTSPTCRCESAWGPEADRHAKLLIHLVMEGSLLDAYSHSSAPNINHELETLERVPIGAQQRLEHAYAIFTHVPPLLRVFVSNARIDHRCVELHKIPGSLFGIVFVTDGTAAFLVAPKSPDIVCVCRARAAKFRAL